MTMEKEMRNSPIYKVLEEIDANQHFMAYDQFVSSLVDKIKEEAPEVYELWMADNELFDCPSCGSKTNHKGAGVCENCEDQGVWIDPAGGVHSNNEEDPASMYE